MNDKLLKILYGVYSNGYKTGFSKKDPISEKDFKIIYETAVEFLVKSLK